MITGEPCRPVNVKICGIEHARIHIDGLPSAARATWNAANRARRRLAEGGGSGFRAPCMVVEPRIHHRR
jgi:hypothetical protein